MQLDAWKSGDEIQKRYIDKVFDVPAAEVLRFDRVVFVETVRNIMNTTDILQDKLRYVSEQTRGRKFNTKRKDWKCRSTSFSKKLEDLQQCKTRGACIGTSWLW